MLPKCIVLQSFLFLQQKFKTINKIIQNEILKVHLKIQNISLTRQWISYSLGHRVTGSIVVRLQSIV